MTTFFKRVKEPERTKAEVPEVRPDNLPKNDTPSPSPLLCTEKLRQNNPLVGYLFLVVFRVEEEAGPPSAKQNKFRTPSTEALSTPSSPRNPSQFHPIRRSSQ